jgi:RNA polymerase sigma-70 factor, ECF subfamily
MALTPIGQDRPPASKPDEGRRRLAGLLAQTARGDQDAFSALYAATAVKMRMTVAPMVHDPAELEDLVQEGYLKVWCNAHRFRPSIASPITWMMRIFRNCAIDRLRRPRPTYCSLDEEALSIADDSIDPLATHDQARQMQYAVAAMRSLTPDRAELLAQAYLEELSREVLARRYKVPAATIKTWLRRSLATVRAQMACAEPLN